MRTGNWIATYTGMKWFVIDPHPDDVRIEDIAHGLSMICRFGGHTKRFYSVAEHCVRVARLVASWHPDNYFLQLHALLHDASEAYIGDIVRPLKYTMPSYLDLEAQTMAVIFEGIKLEPWLPCENVIIKQADDSLLMTERRDLFEHRTSLTCSVKAKPISTPIAGWSPGAAEMLFLATYNGLRKRMEDPQ